MSEPVNLKSFEQSFEELEAYVQKLEGGALTLDESLAHYEHGVHALKRCYQILELAEKRLEVLVRESDGGLVTKPIDLNELRGEARASGRVLAVQAQPPPAQVQTQSPQSVQSMQSMQPVQSVQAEAVAALPTPATSTSTMGRGGAVSGERASSAERAASKTGDVEKKGKPAATGGSLFA